MSFVLNQLALAFFNFVNSRIDAYRILRNKHIAHGINFTAYALFAGLVIWIADYNLPNAVLFCFSAFFGRQIVFDPALNLRRNLSFFYQSTANPPRAIMDRIERILFPDNDGRKIFYFYLIMWTATIGIKISFL